MLPVERTVLKIRNERCNLVSVKILITGHTVLVKLFSIGNYLIFEFQKFSPFIRKASCGW